MRHLLRLEPGKLAGCSAPQSVEHLRALLDEGVGAGHLHFNFLTKGYAGLTFNFDCVFVLYKVLFPNE